MTDCDGLMLRQSRFDQALLVIYSTLRRAVLIAEVHIESRDPMTEALECVADHLLDGGSKVALEIDIWAGVHLNIHDALSFGGLSVR